MPPRPAASAKPEQLLRDDDRRAWVRYPRRLEMFWQFFGIDQEDLWSATVQDVSASGVGMSVSRDFPPGTLLTIRLPTTAHGWCSCLVRVKRCHATGPDTFQAGCAFVRPLTDAELRSLLV